MFGLLAYLGLAGVIAGILTFFFTLAKPLPKRAEGNPWMALFMWFVLIASGPYVWVEGSTRYLGSKVRPAVEDAYEASEFAGPLRYFRIVSWSSNRARALAVGSEKEAWGGMDHPMLSMELRRQDDGSWKCDSYQVLASSRLNKESFVFPPYW